MQSSSTNRLSEIGPPSLVLGGRQPASYRRSRPPSAPHTERWGHGQGPPSLVVGGRLPTVDRPPPYSEPEQIGRGPPSLVVGGRQPSYRSWQDLRNIRVWPPRDSPPPYTEIAQHELDPPSLIVGGSSRFEQLHHDHDRRTRGDRDHADPYNPHFGAEAEAFVANTQDSGPSLYLRGEERPLGMDPPRMSRRIMRRHHNAPQAGDYGGAAAASSAAAAAASAAASAANAGCVGGGGGGGC